MITLTRRQVHALRAVFRRSTLGIAHRGPIPPLVLRTEGTQLCLEHRYEALGVRYSLTSGYRPNESVLVPFEVLADVEGRDQSPVTFEAAAPDRTVVRWEDRGIPQQREHVVPAADSLALLPEPPADWTTCPGSLLDALAEARQTCNDNDRRYALGCIQLRGGAGEIVATDGRQLLVQRGHRFPWDGDVLIRHTPLFTCRELPRDQPLSIASSETDVALRAGNWTIFLEIQKDARYPDVARALPADGSETSRVHLDPADAAYLADAIERLPGAELVNSPVTLDLNGRVSVRARDPEHARTTELVLARSRYTGTPIRVSSNRDLLARAMRLGFGELLIADVESPVWCRDGRRVFAWQPLDKDSVVEPTDDAVRIESCVGAAANGEPPMKARNPVIEKPHPAANGTSTHSAANGEARAVRCAATSKPNALAVNESAGPVGLTALIRETEALHQTLTDAKRRTARLIAALRRHKKRERLVANTLTALKELKLSGVSE